jgi:hypothetical protein
LGLQSKAALEAFKELAAERRVANLGTARKTRYVLAEHYRPLEIACDHILGQADLRALTLHSRTSLLKGLSGAPASKLDEALDWLVKEGRLLQVRHGRGRYYLHADAVRARLPKEDAEPAPPAEDLTERVLTAWRILRRREGFSDVRIFDLHQASGVPLDRLKDFLLEMSRLDRAVLSLGDWSLSSEEVRSGAVDIHGRRNLLVRFKE